MAPANESRMSRHWPVDGQLRIAIFGRRNRPSRRLAGERPLQLAPANEPSPLHAAPPLFFRYAKGAQAAAFFQEVMQAAHAQLFQLGRFNRQFRRRANLALWAQKFEAVAPGANYATQNSAVTDGSALPSVQR